VQYSPSSLDGDEALVYTMEDLLHQVARVMSEIEKAGKRAFITKRGRFIAIIEPLEPGHIESRALAEMAREVAEPGQT
jgi:hypothetical protein